MGCGKGLADLASFLGRPPHHVRGKDSDKRKVGKEARADIVRTSQFLGHPEECTGPEEPVQVRGRVITSRERWKQLQDLEPPLSATPV